VIRVTWGASGTPREVVASVGAQAVGARKACPDAGAVIMAARDALWAAAQRHAPDAVLTVSASIMLSVTDAPSEPPPAVAMVADVPDDGEGDETMDGRPARVVRRRFVA